jgi:hypothetical protein
MLQDIDEIDFVAFFVMDPGSGAGATTDHDGLVELSRTAVGNCAARLSQGAGLRDFSVYPVDLCVMHRAMP